MEKIVEKLDPDTQQAMSKILSLGSCWELLFHIEKDNVKTKQDILMLMVHLILIKNDFLCIHEEDAQYSPTKTSELLTPGWNKESENHRIRYYCNNAKYHLSSNLIVDVLSINLLNMDSQKTQSIVIPVSEVKEISGSLSTIIPNEKDIFCKIWTEMVKPAKSEGQRDMQVQTDAQPQPQRERFEPNIPFMHPGRPEIFYREPTIPDPLRVGDRDLNPFAPFGAPGGGMLMEPPRGRIPLPDRDFPGPGMLPRGAVPPGARFDPILPGMPGRRSGPDPDHMRMPGAPNFDNMFM
ncbi:proteasome inhibitor PI31 subunit [Neocloeon triangulifer]|uniref:proteasome inhibitor PI31 subunit n=1 Tax=Neocloeon triangulifer TaxID=2078957 RepID=UPI00286EDD95|nr:proteasome inhibitor PI31 subunit [Neocloeon triangulifer]